jgi:hypothetical protein
MHITLLDLGRSLYVWAGRAEAAPRLGALFASVPGGGAAGGLPPAASQLLDGSSEFCDEDACDSFSRALAVRSGKQVLISFNVGGLGAEQVVEVQRRCLALLQGEA